MAQVCFPATAASDVGDSVEQPPHIRAFERLPPVQKHPFMLDAQASGALPKFESLDKPRFGRVDCFMWLLYVVGVAVALTIFTAFSAGTGDSEL